MGRAPRTFTQWLLDEVYLPMDGGPHQGLSYQFRFQPITRLWAAEIDSGRWNEFIYSGPSQSGKSLSGYVLPMLYHITELNESVGFGVPMEEMAADKWTADIKPILETGPGLRKFMPRSGPGSSGGTIRDRVEFSNRAVAKILTAGGSDQSKAGYTLRVILVTEASRFSRISATSPEADPLEQMRARQRSFKTPDRRTYIDGTKTIDTELPASLWPVSSMSRIVAQCPHCGNWILPGRENLVGWQGARTEIEAAEKAFWACPKCGEAITDKERHAALMDAVLLHGEQTITKRGEVIGELPKTRRLFFDYSAWHNVFLDAADIAVDCWSADQIEAGTPARESAERKLCQFVFGVVYTPPVDEYKDYLEQDDIDRRRTALPRGLAPPNTQHLVAGIDVGEKFIHWCILAVLADGGLNVVDYGTAEVPRDESLKVGLKRALKKLFADLSVGVAKQASEGSADVRVALNAGYVDSGHLPEIVFAAIKEFRKETDIDLFLPILGRGETQMTKRRYTAPAKTGNVVKKIDPDGRWHLSRVRRAGIDQLTLDADAYKIISENGFRTTPGSPGSITLFSGPGTVHRAFVRHQINEQWITEEIPGEKPKSKFVQTGANHYKDALAYAICAATRRGWSPTSYEIVDAPLMHDYE